MINRVILVGRLTRDVEVRKTPSGLSVASFTVACDRRYSKSQDNSQQSADFINCVAWRQSADFLGNYAHKGSLVGVEGRLQSRSYDDQNGNRRYVTEVVCDSVNLLESKSQSQQRTNDNYSQPSYQSNPTSSNNDFGNDDFGDSGLDLSSDDLPF